MNQPSLDGQSQIQDNLVRDTNVSGDLIFAPVQVGTKIETQIVQISVAKVTQQPLIKASPYKGLKRFNFRDREYFFGRDALIAKLFKAVNSSSFSLVLGASGSGKSSVIRAGLIPELKKSLESQKFYDFIFTPNEDPFDSLYRCLLSEEKDYSFRKSKAKIALEARPNTITQVINTLKKDEEKWFLFIDQFEQLFTICTDLEKRKNFIKGIVQVAKKGDSSVRIVLAMRSDFLEQFSFYPTLGAIANQNNIHLVTEMYPDELRQAIEQPAAKHGVVFEEGLVEQIIKEVEGQKGYLPLLQYTLDLLWERECTTKAFDGRPHIEDRTLNKTSYAALEGVRGALQKRVNEIYQDICEKNKDGELVTKQIFLKLVNIDESASGSRPVSRRAYRYEFVGEPVESTLKKFIDEKLLVSSYEYSSEDELLIGKSTKHIEHATIEIAHEILLSSWNKLKRWLEEEKEAIILKNWLAGETRRWLKVRAEDESKANDELLKGSRLEQIVGLRKDNAFEKLGGLVKEENQFIDASVDWRDRQIKQKLAAAQKLAEANRKARIEAEKREKEQKKANKKLRVQAFVAVTFGMVASLLGITSLYSSQEAQLKERAANIKVRLSLSNETDRLLESLQLAGDNDNFNQRWVWFPPRWFKPKTQLMPEAQSVLYQAVEESREIYVFNTHHSSSLDSVAFSPDGQYFVSEGGKTLQLWDMKQQQLIHTFNDNQDGFTSVTFSPDGKYIVSGGDKTLKLWDMKQQQLIHTFNAHQSYVRTVAFSPDGKHLVSGSDDHTVKLWDMKQQQLIHTFNAHQGQVYSVTFSPDGKYLVSGGEDNTLKLWNIKQQQLIHTFNAYQEGVSSVAFSPDGNYLVSGSYDHTVKLWNIKQQQLIHTFNAHQDPVKSVAFSPDSNYLVSGSWDKTVKLWDVRQQQLIHTFNGHQSTVESVAFSPDGNYIFSGSLDGTIKLWEGSNQSLIHTFNAHQGGVYSVAFSPDGKYLVSGGWDNKVKLWDVEQQQLIHTFNGHQKTVKALAFSPDGKYFVSGSGGNKVKLWDVEQQQLIHTLNSHPNPVSSLAFSPDGKYFVSGSVINDVELWNIKQQRLIHNFSAHRGSVRALAFSPDGKYFVSGGDDNKVKLWDVEQQQLIYTFNGHQYRISSVAFSPDGKYLVSGGWDNKVKLWDVEQQQLIHTFNGHQSYVSSVTFSSDGKYIVSGSGYLKMKLWYGTDWQDWLAIGCQRIRLHPTLVSMKTDSAPEAANTCMKYGRWSDLEKAEFLVKQGLALAAEEGNLKEAKAKFKQAYKLDSTNVNLAELEAQANQLTALKFIEKGINEVVQGNVTKALSHYNQAQNIDPNLAIDAESWNILCWAGSIYRYADEVLDACEKAVELAPNEVSKAGYLDSRGLAKALTGDTKGAIKDFQALVNYSEFNEESRNKRKQWIEALKQGKNPFTDEVLEDLKNE